jgi:hypothetical protein
MKTYNIRTYIPGQSWNEEITGNLYCSDGYYRIEDKDGKSHYFPVIFTVIIEL